MRQASRRTLAAAVVAAALPVALAGAQDGQPPAGPASAAGVATIDAVNVAPDRRHATVELSCPASAGTACVTGVSATAAGAALNTAGKGGRARVFQGAMVGQAPTTASLQPGGGFYQFEAQARKGSSLMHWGQPWAMNGQYLSFPTAYMDHVRAHGSIPVLNWASWDLGKGVEQPNFRLRDVYNGTFDPFITAFARQAAAWGHPFMLRFNHEMNGWWYPWGTGITAAGHRVNGNRVGDYVKAWRHVHRIFARVGARNVTWLWTPNIVSKIERYPNLRRLYPGNRYVDWTGLSGYNRNANWLGPNSVFTGRGTRLLANSYGLIRSIAPHKPSMLAETGSIEAGDGGQRKARWIRELFMHQIPRELRGIKAVMWFDWDIEPWATMRIDSSVPAVNALASSVASPFYASNQYSGLSTSPIPAPRELERRLKWVDIPAGSSRSLTVSIPPGATRRLRSEGGEVRFTATALDRSAPPATRSASVGR